MFVGTTALVIWLVLLAVLAVAAFWPNGIPEMEDEPSQLDRWDGVTGKDE